MNVLNKNDAVALAELLGADVRRDGGKACVEVRFTPELLAEFAAKTADSEAMRDLSDFFERQRPAGPASESRPAFGLDCLEPENFRIDSSGWKKVVLADGARIKMNPEGDVTEFIDGEHAGEQHFSYYAAVREVEFAGKRIPNADEWHSKIMRGRSNRADSVDALNLPFAGFRKSTLINFTYADVGKFGYYWVLSPSGAYVAAVGKGSVKTYAADLMARMNGVSVRCLRAG